MALLFPQIRFAEYPKYYVSQGNFSPLKDVICVLVNTLYQVACLFLNMPPICFVRLSFPGKCIWADCFIRVFVFGLNQLPLCSSQGKHSKTIDALNVTND